jgi:hypothetical protein
MNDILVDRTEAVARLLAIEVVAKTAITNWRTRNWGDPYPVWAREILSIIKGGIPPT